MKIIFFILSLIISSSLFANVVARVSAINGDVSVTRDSAQLKVINGFSVKEKDTIITQNKSKVQLIFKDDTIISIGKNSNFSIEKYLYLETKKPIAKFKMLNGMVRVITGKIGKIAPHRFSIKIKTATIGIRGTNFGLILAGDNLHQSFCTSGAIDIKLKTKKYLLKDGFFMRISKYGEVNIREFTKDDIQIIKNNNFIMNQDFRNIMIKNSTIISKVKIDKNVSVKNSNLANSFRGKNININNSKIKSDITIGENSTIENSNLGNDFKSKNLKIINSNITTKTVIGKNTIIKNSNLGTKAGSVSNLNSTSNVKIDNGSKIQDSNLGIIVEE